MVNVKLIKYIEEKFGSNNKIRYSLKRPSLIVKILNAIFWKLLKTVENDIFIVLFPLSSNSKKRVTFKLGESQRCLEKLF